MTGDVACFEIFPAALPAPKPRAMRTKAALELSPFPAVRRDFAFEVDAHIAADDVVRAARGASREMISDVSVFDVFSGAGLADGRKSLAISVVLQPQTATLTDAEIDDISAQIIAAIAKATGAQLRG